MQIILKTIQGNNCILIIIKDDKLLKFNIFLIFRKRAPRKKVNKPRRKGRKRGPRTKKRTGTSKTGSDSTELR